MWGVREGSEFALLDEQYSCLCNSHPWKTRVWRARDYLCNGTLLCLLFMHVTCPITAHLCFVASMHVDEPRALPTWEEQLCGLWARRSPCWGLVGVAPRSAVLSLPEVWELRYVLSWWWCHVSTLHALLAHIPAAAEHHACWQQDKFDNAAWLNCRGDHGREATDSRQWLPKAFLPDLLHSFPLHTSLRLVEILAVSTEEANWKLS